MEQGLVRGDGAASKQQRKQRSSSLQNHLEFHLEIGGLEMSELWARQLRWWVYFYHLSVFMIDHYSQKKTERYQNWTRVHPTIKFKDCSTQRAWHRAESFTFEYVWQPLPNSAKDIRENWNQTIYSFSSLSVLIQAWVRVLSSVCCRRHWPDSSPDTLPSSVGESVRRRSESEEEGGTTGNTHTHTEVQLRSKLNVASLVWLWSLRIL